MTDMHRRRPVVCMARCAVCRFRDGEAEVRGKMGESRRSRIEDRTDELLGMLLGTIRAGKYLKYTSQLLGDYKLNPSNPTMGHFPSSTGNTRQTTHLSSFEAGFGLD
uniref:Uncharacterized protein n=1 Tax=Oryza brachyantha TaxID=4533 RepID=J3N838_ORYBR